MRNTFLMSAVSAIEFEQNLTNPVMKKLFLHDQICVNAVLQPRNFVFDSAAPRKC